MIKIGYRNIIPDASLDTSLTTRWGYRPLKVKDFAFGTEKLFKFHSRAAAFGSDAAVLAKTLDQRYFYAKSLIRKVISMAHTRGIRVAMGFEFGVYPPELFSAVPNDSFIKPNMLPDPTHPASREILYNTIDDILFSYPELDQIWLWLQENEVYPGQALSTNFREWINKDKALFSDSDDNTAFRGVWSLSYIRMAHNYLKEKSSKTKLVISGWGGKNQLEAILEGLHNGLPKDITFTCLNPLWGQLPQPSILGEISKNREVWCIPWLEGDWQLWHPQLRASLIRDHILLARKQGLQGVIAAHWRTQDIKSNFEAFTLFSKDPDTYSIDAFYTQYVQKEYGDDAIVELAPLLIKIDKEQWFTALTSPEYLPYHPSWGRLNSVFRIHYEKIVLIVKELKDKAPSAKYRGNLAWLEAVMKCVLLLDEVSEAIEPAYNLHEQWLLKGKGALPPEEIDRCKKIMKTAPIEDLFKIYASRVRSRGELGVLSSMNQKLWLQYIELRNFLNKAEE